MKTKYDTLAGNIDPVYNLYMLNEAAPKPASSSTSKGILILDVCYHNHKGISVTVKIGTPILVDEKEGVALIGDDYVDIAEWEYVLLFN
jgi:hypothetical protein